MPEFQPAPGSLPPGHRVYAIGDVHGCDDQLASLHAMVAADLAARPVARPLLVHLGDYVDRGPASAGVVARLAGGSPLPGVPVVNLMGNHERTMLDALHGERAAVTDWRISGGGRRWRAGGWTPMATRRFGRPASRPRIWISSAAWRCTTGSAATSSSMPGCGRAWRWRTSRPTTCIRIRHAFLNSEADFGAVVVHGHSPTRGPVVRPNRIGIDTGAVFGRELTCLVLEDDRLAFLQA